ncbi:MAG: YigZ family protein [Bacteroidota bacterium]
MMFEDTYKTIKEIATGQFKDRGSKFIGFAFPVCSEEDVKIIVADTKKKYHDASHHCYAYILGSDKSAYRINDDGEPSGTAGKPIHGQILSKDLTNILVIVIRYFGGTKLGVSGLINAYKQSASEAINNAVIIEKTVDEIYEVTFDYLAMNDVMRILKDDQIKQLNQEFELICKITFSIRKQMANKITDQLQKIDKTKVVYLRTE